MRHGCGGTVLNFTISSNTDLRAHILVDTAHTLLSTTTSQLADFLSPPGGGDGCHSQPIRGQRPLPQPTNGNPLAAKRIIQKFPYNFCCSGSKSTV